MRKLFFLIQHHICALKMSLCHLVNAPLATLTTVSTIGVSLSLAMSLYLLTSQFHTLLQGNHQNSAITLYIDAKSSAADINAIRNEVKQNPAVIQTHYITPKEALEEFESQSNLKNILALLPENPLPGVLSIQVNTQHQSRDALIAFKNSLAKHPNVQMATLDDEWTEKLHTLFTFGSTLANFFYLLIGLSVTLMIANTLRLALENQREEMDVLNLIGATQHFIRRPFLYRGMLYGVLGGVLALLILWTEIHFFQAPLQSLTSVFETVFNLHSLPLYQSLVFLAFTLILGWLGAIWAFYQQKRAILQES